MERVSDISKRLKEYRDRFNLTQLDVSKKCRVPYQTLSRYELGQRVPKIDTAVEIAEALGINPLWLQGKENYFFLRVNGESMKNAGIHTGDLVLIRRQKCADDGQVVAARVNGDEATLKRYKRQGDSVILIPENPEFEPRIVPIRDFETGDAEIIGIALEVRHTL